MPFAVYVALDVTSHLLKWARICGVDAMTQNGDAFSETVRPDRPISPRMSHAHSLWDRDVERARTLEEVVFDFEAWAKSKCPRGMAILLVVRSKSFEGEILSRSLTERYFRGAIIADTWFVATRTRGSNASGPSCAALEMSFDVLTKVKADFERDAELCLSESRAMFVARRPAASKGSCCCWSLGRRDRCSFPDW